MRSWLALCLAAALAVAPSTADAGYCGAARYRCCKPAHGRGDCAVCKPQCCTLMKTCQEVTYEEKELTTYQTVFEELKQTNTIDTVKYVPETEYRIVCTTVSQSREVDCPRPCCDPGAKPTKCVQQVPVSCLRKVPVTVIRAVPAKETVESVRVVEKKVPKTVTCLIPKVTYVQVPVQVCCPVPCCCK
ncbi:MAG: hypothetical protein ACUVUC_10925 [Thermoguttaceae bacterium]